MAKLKIVEEDVAGPRRLLSWDELHRLQALPGVQRVNSQSLPGVGYFVTVTGTERGVERVRKALGAK